MSRNIWHIETLQNLQVQKPQVKGWDHCDPDVRPLQALPGSLMLGHVRAHVAAYDSWQSMAKCPGQAKDWADSKGYNRFFGRQGARSKLGPLGGVAAGGWLELPRRGGECRDL